MSYILNQNEYRTIIFDCDGVVLNSNKIKTEAFYNVAKEYGHSHAKKLKDYHVQNGGVSRYSKFEYFITEILAEPLDQSVLDRLLTNFAAEVREGLRNCEVASGLPEFRARTENTNWVIVSGSDQNELREIFVQKGLDSFFDGGIFGSPDTKDTILSRELERQNIRKPGIFIGDSKYDYNAAINAGLDFVFVTQWTEVSNWSKWISENKIKSAVNISDLFC